MVINRSAWHYRFLNRMSFQPSDSRTLCGYFWKLMIALFLVSVVATFLGGVAVFLVVAVIHHPWEALWAVLVIVGMIGGLFLAFVGSFWLLDNKERINAILPAYVRALKDRVCPLVQFHD